AEQARGLPRPAGARRAEAAAEEAGMAEAARAVMRSIALAAALVILAACARDKRQALRGEWRNETGRMVVYRGGQMLGEEGDSAASMARYDFPDKHRLRIRSLAATPVVYTLNVTRDSLVMCREDQPAQCYHLARVQGE